MLGSNRLISFCTTCKNRTQHLELTLGRNLSDNAGYPSAKFIVLDYNSSDHLLDYLRINHREHLESGRLVVYSSREAGAFRMAHAKNMAHRLGMLEGGDVLVNLDADNFTGPDFAKYLAEHFASEPERFLWAKMVKQGPERLPRGINGRIAVTSRAFVNVGGYDEQFDTWSPDDKDFNLRLQRLGYRGREIERRFLSAVMHNDRMRFREYPHASAKEEAFESVQWSEATIVNWGKIGCGSVFRNLDPEQAVELRPLPTRIFGIGMHKTATTSLHAALNLLGLDSAHWKNAHWAKAIYEEMIASGRSSTLERHYALSDLPITLLYKELDRAYPGSKFILTVRGEEAWLKSVENHWSHERNPFRSTWSTDPFTHRVHRLLYGQKGFDRDIFLARYRRHNTEVLEYFKDRPDDLLVMDMDRGAGWNELCSFLNCPVPAGEYPRRLITKQESK